MVRPGGRREDGGQCIEMSLLFWNGECLKGQQGEREAGEVGRRWSTTSRVIKALLFIFSYMESDVIIYTNGHTKQKQTYRYLCGERFVNLHTVFRTHGQVFQ